MGSKKVSKSKAKKSNATSEVKLTELQQKFRTRDSDQVRQYRNDIRGSSIDINVGPRYVFFQSLQNQPQLIYKELYGQGMSYVHQVKNVFDSTTLDATSTMSRMQHYANLMKDLTKRQQANEQKFFYQMKKKLKDKGKLNKKLIEEFQKFAKQPTNYIVILELLNDLMKENAQAQKKIDQLIFSNAEVVESAIKKIREQDKEQEVSQQQKIDNLFKTNIKRYNQKVNAAIQEIIEGTKFQTSYINLLSERINSTIGAILKNSTFMTQLEQIFEAELTPKGISINGFGNQLVAAIVKELSSYSVDKLQNSTSQQIANEVIDAFSKDFKSKFMAVNEDYIELIQGQVTKRGKRKDVIEAVALETGRGTARFFSQLESDKERNDIIQEYLSGPEAAEDLKIIRTFNEKVKAVTKNNPLQTTSVQLGRVSKILNKYILKKMQEKYPELIDAIKNRHMSYNDAFLQVTGSATGLKQAISVAISGSALGEVFTTEEIKKQLDESLKYSKTPGNKIKLKNDITILLNFDEKSYSRNVKINTMLGERSIISFPDNFITRYSKESKNTTNVQLASDIFLDQLHNLKLALDGLLTQGKITQKQHDQYLQDLSQYMIGGVSVKEYTYASNEGFHGGTLGPNLQSVVNNIESMYALGGITRMDTDMLYFAIANCGPDTVGHELKGSLQTYLAGAAAMMMFDEGFTAMENYIKQMQEALKIDSGGPASLHLFTINGKYVPASFLYSSIADSVGQMIGDVNTKLNNLVQTEGSNAITINNTISRKNIPSFIDVPNAQDRWDSVKQLTNSTLSGASISFTFMGGVMDILKSISDAFKP